MLVKWYKNFAYVGAIFWLGTGLLTVGSIALSSIGWGINIVIGVLFLMIGIFLYLRAMNFYRFYEALNNEKQINPHFLRFLRLEFILILGECFIGGVILAAGISRVFGEGYAIFG